MLVSMMDAHQQHLIAVEDLVEGSERPFKIVKR